jgi:hypothetical protein
MHLPQMLCRGICMFVRKLIIKDWRAPSRAQFA